VVSSREPGLRFRTIQIGQVESGFHTVLFIEIQIEVKVDEEIVTIEDKAQAVSLYV
jgi:hypothetical protein